MATVTHAATAIWTTTAGNKTSNSFTPAVNDLLVVVAPATGVATSAVTDNNADGNGAYTKIGSSFTGFSTAGDLSIWVRNSLVGSATATTVTVTQTSSTGGGVDVFQVSGMSRTGSGAVRQNAGQSSGTSGTTPAPALGSAALTGNPLIGAVCCGTNASTNFTPRTGWTEATDLGYNTPATGMETMFISSGETASTITWGSTAPSAFASMVVELDTSIPGAATLTGTGFLSAAGQIPTPGPPLGTLNQAAGGRVSVIRAGLVMASRIPPAAAATQPGTATLTGAGFLSTAFTQGATATLTGAGFLSTAVTQGAGKALDGAASLSTAATQGAGSTVTGTGFLSPLVTQGVTAALTGTGFLSTAVTQGATAALTGTGFLSGSAGGAGASTLTGTGFLSPLVTQGAIAAVTGTGFLSTAVTQGATAALTGTGFLTAAGTVPSAGGPPLTPLHRPVRARLPRPSYAGWAATMGSYPGVAPAAGAATLTGTGYLSAGGTSPGSPGPPLGTLHQPAGSRAFVTRAGLATATRVTPSVITQGAATLTGAGVLGTAATQGAGGTATGAGFLSPAVTQGATAALIGTGFLGTTVTQGATAALAGTGFLSPAAVQGVTATLTGTGFLNAAGSVPASSGPLLTPLHRPVRARLPVAPDAPVRSGRAMAMGGILITQPAATSGPPLIPLRRPVRARRPLPPHGVARGTTQGTYSGSGLPVPPLPQPAGIRISAARTGHVQRSPVRAQAAGPQAGAATLVGTGFLSAGAAVAAQAPALHRPVRARLPVAPDAPVRYGRAMAMGAVLAPTGPTAHTESGPFNITLPGGWARVRSGPFTPALPKPAISMAGFPGTRSTLAIAIPLPRTAWTGTRLHQPLKITIANPRLPLTGTVKHQPVKIVIPAPHLALTGTVKHQPLKIVIPLPRISGTSKVIHQPFRPPLPAPKTTLTGKVLHQPLKIVIPAPKTTLTGTRLHQPLKITIPAPRTGLAGFPAHAGPFAIHLGLTRLLRRGATPEDLARWQEAKVATAPAPAAPVPGRAMATTPPAPPAPPPGKPGVTAGVQGKRPRKGGGVS